MLDLDLDLDIEMLEFAIKHGKHDQRSHGRRTARRRAYNTAYREARSGGATPAEAREKAKDAGLARQAERDARLERMRGRTSVDENLAHNPSSEARLALKRITGELTDAEQQEINKLNAQLREKDRAIKQSMREIVDIQIEAATSRKQPGDQDAYKERQRKIEAFDKDVRKYEEESIAIEKRINDITSRRSLVEVSRPADIDWAIPSNAPRDIYGAQRLPKSKTQETEDAIRRTARLTTVVPSNKVVVQGVDDPRSMQMLTRDASYIMLGYDSKPSTVAHEIGHAIEGTNPEVKQKARAFLDKRTQGEQPQRLSKLLNDPRYHETEVAKPDKFIDPYIGKVYFTGETEIISMGLEFMFDNPRKFAQEDPEYFMFMYDTLRGK